MCVCVCVCVCNEFYELFNVGILLYKLYVHTLSADIFFLYSLYQFWNG